MLRWQRVRSLRSQCPQVQVFFQQVRAAKESVLQVWDCESRAHCALGSEQEGNGLCLGEHWGFVLPLHKAHSSDAAELLYFHQGLLCGILL